MHPAASPAVGAEVLDRVARGDADALAQLYACHAGRVLRTAGALLVAQADAEDVLQDVFLGLPRALRASMPIANFDAWLTRVTVRTALMRLRAHRRRREEPLATSDSFRARRSSPLERVAIEDAIARLPEPLRLVFVLKVVEGYEHQEVARLLGISVGASKVRLFRARMALQAVLF